MEKIKGPLYKATIDILVYEANNGKSIKVEKGSFWIQVSDNYSDIHEGIIATPLKYLICVRADDKMLEGMEIGMNPHAVDQYFEYEGIAEAEEGFLNEEVTKAFIA